MAGEKRPRPRIPRRRIRRRLPPLANILDFLRALPPNMRAHAVASLGDEAMQALDLAWPEWAHEGQRAPEACADGSDWSTWVLMAGRGFGKTRAGAEWITAAIAGGERLRIALVGATLDEARKVMVEGRSGLIEVAGAWLTGWSPSLRKLTFRTGAEATLFSGASPEQLRGPEHHLAWCDELAKWEKSGETWDMLQLGLRLGALPRALITTTPRAGSVLGAIMAGPHTIVTGGPTRANPHLPGAYKTRVETLYAGTRLGEQELEGKLLTDTPGQLWTPELIASCRLDPSPLAGEGDSRANARERSEGAPHDPHGSRTSPHPPTASRRAPLSPEMGEGAFTRTLIAVDPPSGAGTCGIIACARDAGGIAHILADHSVTALSPEGWSAAVAAAAAAHGTQEVVAECNQGGEMIRAILATADPALRVKLVTARTGKTHRATPVAHLFEAGKVKLHARMDALEAELLGMIAGGDYEPVWTGRDSEPRRSPDRADAMVWGVTELMLGKAGKPRVRSL